MSNPRQRIHDCAEIMEWMKESPYLRVKQYLLNRGFSINEINQAAQYFVRKSQ